MKSTLDVKKRFQKAKTFPDGCLDKASLINFGK